MPRLFSLLFAVLGIIAAACLMEVVLRAVEQNSYNSLINDRSSGLPIYRADTTFDHAQSCYDNTVQINSEGLHAPEVTPEKGRDVFRIVVVGNSFVEAVQVPIAQMFTTLLQNELNAQPHRSHTYEVIPVGFSGNGTFLDILYYKRFGESVKPDLVINLATEIELQQDESGATYAPQFDEKGNPIIEFPKGAPNVLTFSMKNTLRESQLAVNTYNRYLILRQNISDDLAAWKTILTGVQVTPTASSDDRTLWSIEGKLLPAFASLAARDGARFMLASWVTSQASSSTAQTLAPHFASIAEDAQFPYLDLAPEISQQSEAEGKSPVWSCDIHWNADGNRYAARALFEYLEAHPSLIGS